MNFKVIKSSDNFGTLVEKSEYNFNQILLHGGGPPGDKGDAGNRGMPGATGGKGNKGDQGDKGSLIWYESVGFAADGIVVVNVNYREDDTVVVSNGDYYKIIKSGSILYYEFQFNFAVTPLSYLLDQYSYDAAGASVNIWHTLSTANPTETNLLLSKKVAGSGFDESNFYKMFIGLDSNPIIINTPFVACNILPHETAGEVFAAAADFSQLALKFRPSSRSNPTINTIFLKYVEVGDIWTFDINNSGAKMKLVTDNSDPVGSKAIFESYYQIFGTPDNALSKVTITHSASASTITSDKDIAVGSVDPTTGFVLVNNKKVKLNFNGDTDLYARQDAHNLNMNVNTFFKRKLKYDHTVIQIDTNKSINIANGGTRPIIFLDGAITPTLSKIVGGDTGDVIVISSKLVPVKIDIKESPGANEIGGIIGTQAKSEYELSDKESLTLYKKAGSTSWSIIGSNKRNPFDFTLYRTQDLQWITNPMEGLMKFTPGFYKIYGPNYLDGVGQPFLPLTAYDETSGSILQVVNSNQNTGSAYSRLFFLYRSFSETILKNEVWVRRGQLVSGVYLYSSWEKMATNTDIANLQVDITNYIDDQINLNMANIFYKLVPNYSILLWRGPDFSDFDSTGKGISGDVVNWQICNGVGGTEDMRGRVPVGSIADIPSVGAPALAAEVDPSGTGNGGSNYSMGDTGGKIRHTLIPSEQGSIKFKGKTDDIGGGTASAMAEITVNGQVIPRNGASNQGSNGTEITVPLNNDAAPHENRQPFLAVAYIQKMPTNIVPPNFCSIPTDFIIASRLLDTYTFNFESTNAVFDGIKLKWNLNGGSDTVVTIPFASLTLVGSVYSFDYQVPGFSTGQYTFTMSIDCTGSNHSHYCAPIIDNVISTSDFVISFEVLTENNPSVEIETIDLIETANPANVINLLTISDPTITLGSGLRQFFAPPNTYNIQIGIAGPPVAVGVITAEYTDNTSGSDQVVYTGPSMYFFNSKAIVDNSGYVQIYDTP